MYLQVLNKCPSSWTCMVDGTTSRSYRMLCLFDPIVQLCCKSDTDISLYDQGLIQPGLQE